MFSKVFFPGLTSCLKIYFQIITMTPIIDQLKLELISKFKNPPDPASHPTQPATKPNPEVTYLSNPETPLLKLPLPNDPYSILI